MTNEEMLGTTVKSEIRDRIRRSVCEHAIYFVGDLYNRGITPVFVFDGTSVPEKTSGARVRRKVARDKIHDRIDQLRKVLIDVADPLLRSQDDFNQLRSLLRQAPPVNPAEDLPYIKSFIHEKLGAPVLNAPDEAEKMCARLTSRGLVAASWTTDTDSFACGATLFVTGLSTVPPPPPAPDATPSGAEAPPPQLFPSHVFNAVIPRLAYSTLGLSFEQFVDLLIMFECDFNTRMPSVGPAKAWGLIKAARAKSPSSSRLIEIAAEMNPHLPWEMLNAERCRSIFFDMTDCDQVIDAVVMVNPTFFCIRQPTLDFPRIRYRAAAATAAAEPFKTNPKILVRII
jgi:5'-3' exonuclease